MNTKSLSRVQIKDADAGTVTAVISTFGVIDHDGDVTSKSTFADGSQVIVSAYGHASWDGQLPIGKGIITTTDSEAVADLQFFMDTTHGRDAFLTVKALSEAGLQEWSYSLHDIKSERRVIDGRPARFIESTTVKEVSPVLKGASINTRTLAVKSGDMKFSDHRDAVMTAIDEVTARALEVVTLRVEQGKSATSVLELADQLVEKAAQFKRSLDQFTQPPADDTADALEREWLRFVALSNGVTT